MASEKGKIAGRITLTTDELEAKAKSAGDTVSHMADSMVASGVRAGRSVENIGAGATKSADTMTRAERSMVQSIERATAAFSAGSKSSSDYYTVLAQQRGIDPKILKPYLDALDAVAPKQKVATDAIKEAVVVNEKYTMSAKAQAAALRGVPAQITDIVVSLQGGQKPLTVLLQQGGQLKDMFGGVKPAIMALGSALWAMVNPLTVAIAVGAGLAYLFNEGEKSVEKLNKSLILTGDYAGKTTGALLAMSNNVADASGTGGSKSGARDALAALAGTGEIDGKNFEKFATTAQRLLRETGQTVDETAKQFAELGKDPVGASEKLNKSMHYLTTETYLQIKALADHGKTFEAGELAQKAYADAMDLRTKRAADNIGTLEQLARGVGKTFTEMWNYISGVGVAETPETKLQSLQKRLSEIMSHAGKDGKVTDWFGGNQVDGLKKQIAETQMLVDLGNTLAGMDQRSAKKTDRIISFKNDLEQYATPQDHLQKALEYAKNKHSDLIGNGISQADYDKLTAGIRKKLTDFGLAGKQEALDKATAAYEVDVIQKGFEAQAAAFADGQRVLDAAHSAGLVSDKDYYESKRAILAADAKVADEALAAEIERESKRKVNKDLPLVDQKLAQVDINKTVFDLEQKRSLARAKAATDLVVLNAQETAGMGKLVNAYDEARQAAQNYLDTAALTSKRALESMGRGTQANALQDALNKVDDRYQGMRDAAQEKYLKSNRGTKDTQTYADQLKVANDFREQDIEQTRKQFEEKTAVQGDWAKGASVALENYADESKNVYAQVSEASTRAFKGMEDALVSWAMTGKLSSQQLFDQIISDIIRMQVRASVTGPLASGLKSLLGFADGGVMTSSGPMPLKAYAGGGVATSPQLAVFGEGSMNEAFVPLPDGKRIPVNMKGGGGSVIINQPLTINAPNATAQTVSQIQAMMPALIASNARVVEGVIRQAMAKRGGAFA
jgi:lambda family phage tail tape measure protein